MQSSETAPEAEVEAVVSTAIGAILKEDDPAMRYTRLTHQLGVYDRAVTRIAEERARCASDLAAGGASFARVAGVLAVGTRSRAQQLVGRGARLPGVIFAFRDQDGTMYGAGHLLQVTPYEEARLQFEPYDKDLFFAGHLLRVYVGPVSEETRTASLYVYAAVADAGERRVRPTQEVHDILFGTRTDS
ncbi:MAG TPA: hypothetical protein VGS19_01175 [Streptosporangiaceae bacterium]|nr:hypothetical protein [Streptosporangiaceae bacterium]